MNTTTQHTASPRQAITAELRTWIVAQARAGCRPEDVLAAMKASGWNEDVALQALEDVLSAHLREVHAKPMPEPAPLAAGNVVNLDGHEIQVLLSLRRPRVVLFGGFLTHAECDALVELARQRLARIAALVNWPVENGEGIQVLRYRPGAEYKAHHDYFDPAQPGSSTILARGGQRVGTLVMYLNTPERGGATGFPDAGLDVAPIKGNAVFFAYERPDPSMLTLHSGSPVIAGEKWVATKWMREGVFN